MKKILFLLLGFLLLSNIAFADTLTFVQISDVHIPQKDVIKYEGRSIANAESNFKRAISAINDKEEIEYVFFTGDSVDRSNKEVYIRFFELVSNLNKQL